MAYKVVRDKKGPYTFRSGTKSESLFTGVWGPDGKVLGPGKNVFTSGMAEEVLETMMS